MAFPKDRVLVWNEGVQTHHTVLRGGLWAGLGDDRPRTVKSPLLHVARGWERVHSSTVHVLLLQKAEEFGLGVEAG